jgi:hypothetical protein
LRRLLHLLRGCLVLLLHGFVRALAL